MKVGVSAQFLEENIKKSEQEWTPLEEKENLPSEIIESLDLSRLQTEEKVDPQLSRAREGILVKGFVVMDDSSRIKVITPEQVASELGVTEHKMSFSRVCLIYSDEEDEPRGPSLVVDLNASEKAPVHVDVSV